MNNDNRLNPDTILAHLQKEENRKKRGTFRVFFGMCPGVGKTYAMCAAAQEQFKLGKNIVAGVVETHGREDTQKMLDGLIIIPKKEILYREKILLEFDLDKVLELKPDIVLVDELAHTNISGSRHLKRYQDVLEILDAGISVYTTLNVQHVESRSDIVQQITGVQIRETVPDSLWDLADQVVLIDISPQELIKRLREGKVYLGDKAARAEDNFFKESYLTALREISLRFVAEKVDHDLQDQLSVQQVSAPWNTNERLIVAVSHSPHSARLIRAGRRMAFNLEAPWLAVHIDNGELLNEIDQATLLENMNLARELGAEVISLYDTDFTEAINRIALEKNATQIILGRPERRTFRLLLDKLIRNIHFVDIHIIRQEQDSPDLMLKRKKSPVPNLISTGPIPYFYTFYLLFIVTIICAFLNPYIGYRAVGYFYIMAITGIGLRSTMGPILFASITSAAVWNYFFIPPVFTFSISETEDKMMCIAFIFIGIFSGYLAKKTKNKEKFLIRKEERSRVLFNLLKDFSTAMDAKALSVLTKNSVRALLDSELQILLAHENKLSRETATGTSISEKEFALALWSFDNKKTAGWSTDTLSQSTCLSIPLMIPGKALGVLLYYPTDKQSLTMDEDILLNSICMQLGTALDHLNLQVQNQNISLLKESEKLHQTLLNSVSHEMRIPLTSIMGSVSALQDEMIQNDQEKRQILNQSLLDSCQRLNRVIENLLNMNRLDSGLLTLRKEWIEVSDLVQSVISHAKSKNNEIVLVEKTPHLYINCDESLLEHALLNLILNAIAYSGEKSIISIEIELRNEKISISVLDQGNGIPEDKLGFLFDKFYRLPGSPSGGVGLGLSIVKGIVEAHNGNVFAHNRHDQKGAVFTVELPWAKHPIKFDEV
jgi:two-component system sensor histidine kinase KdpD